MLDLTGAASKIDRAKKHIEDFDRDRIAFLSSDPYVVVPQFDAEETVTKYVLGPLPPIPADLKLIAGDAAHNLRIALDYLANELVRAAGFPTKNVYFPICESLEKYEADSDGKTKGMPESAKKWIAGRQPYGGGDDALWGLHRLDIIDKHRLLIAVSTRIGKFHVNLTPTPTEMTFLGMSGSLQEGDVLGVLPGKREAHEHMDFTFDIAFGEPEVFAGKPVVRTLVKLAWVVESIISHFDPRLDL